MGRLFVNGNVGLVVKRTMPQHLAMVCARVSTSRIAFGVRFAVAHESNISYVHEEY